MFSKSNVKQTKSTLQNYMSINEPNWFKKRPVNDGNEGVL